MSSDTDIVRQLKRILGKYERVQGIKAWGSTVREADGNKRVILVDDDGKLETV